MPAHIILNLKNPARELLRELEGLDEIEAIERRETIIGRVKDQNGEWMPVLILGIADFAKLKVNRFSIADEAAPRIDEIAIERNSAHFQDRMIAPGKR